MTLIVGKIFNNAIRLESDTKITDEFGKGINPIQSSLKIIIINPFLSFGYAGNLHFANKAIKAAFASIKYSSHKNLIGLLHKINKESIESSHGKTESETDFLVACMVYIFPLAKRQVKLVKIAKGKIEYDLKSAWIGDYQGFREYQKTFLERNFESNDILESSNFAFSNLVKSQKINSVGNFHVALTNNNPDKFGEGLFRYDIKVEVSMEEEIQMKLEPQKWYKVPMGTTAGGAYGISYLQSVSAKTFGIGLHFHFGKFGVLFCPKLNQNGILFKNVNGQEFIDQIMDNYALPMLGIVQKENSGLQYVSNFKTNPNTLE